MISMNDLMSGNLDDKLSISDIDQITEDIIPLLKQKIDNIAARVIPKVTNNNYELPKKIFNINANLTIKRAIFYYISNKKYKENKKLYIYLLSSINKYSCDFLKDYLSAKVKSCRVCPVCKNYIVYSKNDERLIHCDYCFNNIKNIEESLNNSIDEYKQSIKDYLYLVKSFSVHSINGCKCPKCNRFVPLSCFVGDYLICPYPKCHADCTDAKNMKHPVSFYNVSFDHIDSNKSCCINSKIKNNDNENTKVVYISGNENPLSSLDKAETYNLKYKIISEIIKSNIDKYYLYEKKKRIPIKICMLEAFNNIFYKYPEDIIYFITENDKRGRSNIINMIYKEFSNIMESKLPINTFIKGYKVNITDIVDERLNVYNGIKQFTTYLNKDNVIIKKIESKIENDCVVDEHEDSFIGRVISIKDENNNELIDCVSDYNFSSINIKPNTILPSTILTVKYYSIKPKSSLGSLVYIQNIKKKIRERYNIRIDIVNKERN